MSSDVEPRRKGGSVLETLFIGLVNGGVYALSAAGLLLIFSVAGVPNLAHGEVVMIGGLVAYEVAQRLDVPYVLAVLIGGGAGTVVGLVFSLAVFEHLRGRAEEGFLIASLALIFIVEAVATQVFGTQPEIITSAPAGILTIGPARIPETWIIIIVVGVLLCIGLQLFTNRTNAGRVMRAMALNPYAALLMGIQQRVYSNLAFAIGSFCAGIAGGLLASSFPVDPTSGEDIAFKSFIIILFAGMGSIGGALVGGMILGIADAYLAGYVSSSYSDAYLFIILLAIIIIRPRGLFGAKAVARY
jgi:branched-chain amino acid transport system permease protein